MLAEMQEALADRESLALEERNDASSLADRLRNLQFDKEASSDVMAALQAKMADARQRNDSIKVCALSIAMTIKCSSCLDIQLK